MRYAWYLWKVALAVVCGWSVFMGLEIRAEEPKTIGSIERLDPSFDQLVSPDARLEVLADGFEWSEGPVWLAASRTLLFSDIPRITSWRGTRSRASACFVNRSATPARRNSPVRSLVPTDWSSMPKGVWSCAVTATG